MTEVHNLVYVQDSKKQWNPLALWVSKFQFLHAFT